MFAWISRRFHLEDRIGRVWCSLMHDSPTWPIHGHYECGICGRQYRVPWAEVEAIGALQVRRALLSSLPSAILPALLLMAVMVRPSLGAENIMPDASATAAGVLQCFIAGQGEAGGWPLETIEIDASLPKLKKTGRLRAIRRLLPVGQPDYKVLESAGDPTVKHQVIVRYISADEKTTELAASSVALTPANYKIRYAGSVWLGNRLTYAFRMAPRKKREGLINGVLWLDSETGIAVRESGYLAKSPSVFVKRINLTRENELHDGAVAARITYVSVETRLIGRAQLTIVERPASDELAAVGRAAVGQ
jgi:hypothetical protein